MEPSIIYGAEVGINLSAITKEQKTQLEWDLTVASKPWKDNPSVIIKGFREENGYLWVPRQFAHERGLVPDSDLRTTGTPQDLKFIATLDPSRDQVNASNNMVKYLQTHGSGILIAPTGCGKTVLSYSVGSNFQTSLGVFVYAGHMIDNWIEQANLAFGLKPEEIGLVQQDKCDLGKPITIMSIQSLLSRKYPDELYNQIGFLIADEVPRYGAEKWSQVLSQFPAKWRLGVSAEIARIDGLERVMEWNLGKVGYTIKKLEKKLTVVKVHVNTTYPEKSYMDFKRSELEGRFIGDALRYDKKLAKDAKRNKIIVDELLKARKTGRRIILFSKLRAHLDDLKSKYEESLKSVMESDKNYPITTVDYLVGGMKKKLRDQAMTADIKFATYSYCRDAMNDTSTDTLFFATPPGNPLQPAGRLRDKGPASRRPLMIVTFTEDTQFSSDKWERHLNTFNNLGFETKTVKRNIE